MPRQVRLGVINLRGGDGGPGPQDIDVGKITAHPKYNTRQRHNDIAVLELLSSARETAYVHPACLYQDGDVPEKLLISGWGVTRVNGKY